MCSILWVKVLLLSKQRGEEDSQIWANTDLHIEGMDQETADIGEEEMAEDIINKDCMDIWQMNKFIEKPDIDNEDID